MNSNLENFIENSFRIKFDKKLLIIRLLLNYTQLSNRKLAERLIAWETFLVKFKSTFDVFVLQIQTRLLGCFGKTCGVLRSTSDPWALESMELPLMLPPYLVLFI